MVLQATGRVPSKLLLLASLQQQATNVSIASQVSKSMYQIHTAGGCVLSAVVYSIPWQCVATVSTRCGAAGNVQANVAMPTRQKHRGADQRSRPAVDPHLQLGRCKQAAIRGTMGNMQGKPVCWCCPAGGMRWCSSRRPTMRSCWSCCSSWQAAVQSRCCCPPSCEARHAQSAAQAEAAEAAGTAAWYLVSSLQKKV